MVEAAQAMLLESLNERYQGWDNHDEREDLR